MSNVKRQSTYYVVDDSGPNHNWPILIPVSGTWAKSGLFLFVDTRKMFLENAEYPIKSRIGIADRETGMVIYVSYAETYRDLVTEDYLGSGRNRPRNIEQHRTKTYHNEPALAAMREFEKMGSKPSKKQIEDLKERLTNSGIILPVNKDDATDDIQARNDKYRFRALKIAGLSHSTTAISKTKM